MFDPARIVIGTAQIGMDYGIANARGKPVYEAAESIITTAMRLGVTEFDTAQAYGDSEEILGKVIESNGLQGKIKITTKTAFKAEPDYGKSSNLRNSIHASISKLKVKNLFCLLFHNEDSVRHFDSFLEKEIKDLKAEGFIKKIGVSFYSPELVLRALEFDEIDCIQVPANILDSRFEKAGVFQKARAENKTVYIRSVFLQGLLLMEQKNLPDTLSKAGRYLVEIDRLCNAYGISKKELLLHYIRDWYPDAKILLGVESDQQVIENMKILSKENSKIDYTGVKAMFSDVPGDIVNPALWNL